MNNLGQLYVCGTPIGNLGDLSNRLLEVLGEVDLIACEDTRRTAALLSSQGIKTNTTSYHEHNEQQKAPYILDLLKQGKKVALVSDAGMPGISDPGAHLVREALAAGIPVIPVPGANAVALALAVSGMDASRFVFEGFLPDKKSEREERLEYLARDERTLVFFVPPHDFRQFLLDIKNHFGNREMTMARELTKVHEEIKKGNLDQFIREYQNFEPKGEITAVVAGRDSTLEPNEACDFGIDIPEHVARFIKKGYSKKEAMRRVARIRGLSRRDVYQVLLEAKREEEKD